MKGVHAFISATILILVTVIIATMVSSWTVNVSSERSKTIVNATQTKLNCQFAGFLVRNVTYDCSGACFTGSPYRINASIDNSGSSKILLENMFLSLTSGISYRLDGNLSQISAGDLVTKLFDAITINTSSKIPTETIDLRDVNVNGTNTIGLWHLDDGSGNTTVDSSRVNTGTLYNGSTVCNNSTNQCPLWNTSGRFSGAITFDGINDYVLLDSRNFSNTTATVEAWINMQNNNMANNYSIFNTPSEISNTDNGLIGLWHFSQNSTATGGITDSSPYGNNGTATNGPLFTDEGRFQTGWRFDGINDHINTSWLADPFVSGLTISAWVFRRPEGDSILGIVSSGNANFVSARGWDYVIGSGAGCNGNQTFWIGTATGAETLCGNQNISTGRWTHVAVAVDNTTTTNNVRFYVNGTLDAVASQTMPFGNTSRHVSIGALRRLSAGISFFNGTIDEVAVYNRTLSAAEIRDKYLGGLSLHKMGDNLRFVAGNASLSYNISSWTGWHHVAGTYTSSGATLYADAAPVNATSARGIVILGNNSFIGGMNGTISFNGTIDEVRVSNVSRAVNVTLQYNITLPDISAVSVYNYTNAQLSSDTSLGGVARYNKTIADLPVSEFRVEAVDTGGSRVEKWYPYKPGGACVPTGQLDKIQFALVNCPEVSDTYPGSDVTFVRCV